MFQSGLKKHGAKKQKRPQTQQGRRRPSDASSNGSSSAASTRAGSVSSSRNGSRRAATAASSRSSSSSSSVATNSTNSSPKHRHHPHYQQQQQQLHQQQRYQHQQQQQQRYAQQQQQQQHQQYHPQYHPQYHHPQHHHPHHHHPQARYIQEEDGKHLHNSDGSIDYVNGTSRADQTTAPQRRPMVPMTRAKSARWAPDLRSRLAGSSDRDSGPPATPPPSYRGAGRSHDGRSHGGSSSSLASNSQSTMSSRPPQEVLASNSSSHSMDHGVGPRGARSPRRRHGGDGGLDDDGSFNTTRTDNRSAELDLNESMSGLISNRSMGEVSSAPSVKQTTVVHAMTAAMDNPQLFDIVLIGRGGSARVPAAKFVLASRNAGLQTLLYEDPAATEVYMGEYTQDCLQALIEYCHTGEIVRSPLRVDPKSDRGVRGWAQLSHLSNQYDFEALGEEADNVLNAILEYSVGLICSVYDEALAGRFTAMEQMAMSMIQESPTQVLILGNVPGVGYLSPPALEQLLMHELYVNDMTRILILTRWIEWVGRLPENVKVALLCASNIPLDTMDPNFLLTDVKDSGIFDVREVHRAAGISPPPSPGSDIPSPGAEQELLQEQQQSQYQAQTPLYDEDYLYSPDGSLMEDSPMSENYKPKKEKRKKSKKDNKSSLMDGQCYQMRPDGIVIICSTDTPKHLPDFDQSLPSSSSGQQQSGGTSSAEEQHDQQHSLHHHHHHHHNIVGMSQQPHTPGASTVVGGAMQ